MLTQELSSLPTFLYSEVPFQREDSWSHSRNPYPGVLEEYTQASVTVTSIGVANEWDMDRHEQHRPGPFPSTSRKSRTQRPRSTKYFSLRSQIKMVSRQEIISFIYLELSRTVLFKGTAEMF